MTFRETLRHPGTLKTVLGMALLRPIASERNLWTAPAQPASGQGRRRPGSPYGILVSF